MIRDHWHKRNKSYDHFSLQQHHKNIENVGNEIIMTLPHKKNKKNANHLKSKKHEINQLLKKSTKAINKKLVIIEDINESPQEQSFNNFFCFGKGTSSKFKPISLQMSQIQQVPDTIGYSDRRPENQMNKQNVGRPINQIKQYNSKPKSRNQKQNKQQIITYRKNNNLSRKTKPENDQQNQNLQSKSLIEFSKKKHKVSNSKIKNKILSNEKPHKSWNQLVNLKNQTHKIQKSIKLIWECLGDLWETSRISKYNSERNTQQINDLLRRQFQEAKRQQIKQRSNNQIHKNLRY